MTAGDRKRRQDREIAVAARRLIQAIDLDFEGDHWMALDNLIAAVRQREVGVDLWPALVKSVANARRPRQSINLFTEETQET